MSEARTKRRFNIAKIVEQELRDKGYSQPMPSRQGYGKQLDRIERMLKWLIVRKKLDYLSHDLEHNEYKKEFRKPILDDMFKLGEQLPDISDIIEENDGSKIK